MKFINKKIGMLWAVMLLTVLNAGAQEIIKDTVPPAKKSSNKRQKIDGVVATVGDYLILDSDIDKNFIELSSQGNSIKDISRCQMLGMLMEDRLYAHQAIQDSIVVTDAEINGMMDERIAAMLEQTGGTMDKLVKFYKKDSEEDFRSYFFDVLKMGKLTNEMRKKIVEKVEVTPEEVRNFFKKIPQNELPEFGEEVEVSQIVIQPKVSQEEKQKVIDKLNSFKKDIQEGGSSFFSKAVLYSQDPGSKSNGGYYKMNRKTPFVKEFKDVAFSLDEGQISAPFETAFGFHIIYIEKIRGQEVDLRHILLMPKITEESMNDAKEEITNIRQKIVSGQISFADAARSSSDEKETKTNGGALINPKTLDTKFDMTKMDPVLYGQVSNLKTGEISAPFEDEDQSGKKMYKIVMVTNKIPTHTADYAKDYLKIKDLALKEKQIKEIGKWTTEKIKETYIKVNGEYRNCEFESNWLKK
ncbi:peptidylprolyl isomerase [Flavobacterium sp. BFFFF1]|uniref:peptidylprolyl isomerase n=1 Tax=Flavobacterium sp. BFFFF1 TaxID=2015557 RepID=UPI0025B88A4C|nr:peptidylprolyl isomerase [Flavobacterium sp. BFFFF1]